MGVDIPWLGDAENFIEVPSDIGCQLTVEKKVRYGFLGRDVAT